MTPMGDFVLFLANPKIGCRLSNAYNKSHELPKKKNLQDFIKRYSDDYLLVSLKLFTASINQKGPERAVQ